MSTITNKKGNSGYIVKPWNFTAVTNGINGTPLFSVDSLSLDTIQYTLVKANILSCGKVRMTAEIESDKKDGLAKQFFAANQKVYATIDDAKAAIKEDFNKRLKGSLSVESKVRENLSREPELYNYNKEGMDRHAENTAELNAAYKKLHANEIKLEIVKKWCHF